MKITVERIIFLFLLSVFAFGMLTGCRQSPLLQQVIYVDKVQVPKPVENAEQESEKPEPLKDNSVAEDNGNDEQQNLPPNAPEPLPQGEGDTEYGAGEADGDGASLQVVTDGGIIAEVPESRHLVTTVSETTQNPHWKSSITNDSGQYTGEVSDGVFEGQGTYLWIDGEKYEGEWKNGMFSGQGIYTWINGDQYEGEWRTEVFSGQGIYRWASGSTYEGEWKDGVKEGYGTYTWANGDQYTGQWKAGVKEGRGIYTWADGSVYDGEWKFGIKQGRGTYRGADGTVYDGMWANDRFVY